MNVNDALAAYDAAIVNKKERSSMKGVRKRAILIYAIGFVIGRASFFAINPLAIGYFSAAYLEKVKPSLLSIIILTGISSAMPATIALKYLLTMISSIVLLESPIIKKKDRPINLYFLLPAVS